MAPRVSIITTTFNHAAYVGECVRSALAQSYQDWEMLVVDDGSTDGTADIVAGFPDQRIRLFRRPNIGVLRLAETYNFALTKAEGSLIAILEGDDFWVPQKLERQVPLFDDDSLVLAYAELGTVVDGRRRDTASPMRRWPAREQRNDPIGAALGPILTFDGMLQPATWLVRRSALIGIGGFRQVPGIPTTDFPTLLALCCAGRFAYDPKILAYWRKHEAQTTNRWAGAVFSGCADYAWEFYEREVSADMKKVIGVLEEELRRATARQRAFGRFRQGRSELLASRWPQARGSFREAWRGGSLYVRAASAAGWMAGWLHADLEAVARLMGKEWYRRAA